MSPTGPFAERMCHPRNYGTFPRVLGRYVREKHVLGLEEAVAKMTRIPAERFGLTDRGVIKEQACADLVVFDPQTVADEATFLDPRRQSVGIKHVIVNGVPVVDAGEHTGALPGRVV